MKKLITFVSTIAWALTITNNSFGMLTKMHITRYAKTKSLHPNISNKFICQYLNHDPEWEKYDYCPCGNDWSGCAHLDNILCPDVLKKKNKILLSNRMLKIRDILENNKLKNLLPDEDRDYTQHDAEDALEDLNYRNEDIIELLNKDINDIHKQIDILKEQQFLARYLELPKIYKIEEILYTTFDIKKDNENE